MPQATKDILVFRWFGLKQGYLTLRAKQLIRLTNWLAKQLLKNLVFFIPFVLKLCKGN